jgi:hypothetical protein
MIKCENCIHYEVCGKYVAQVGSCDYFKDETLFIKLPCKVGTPVFIVNKMGRICSGKFRLDDIDQFGKRAFLTRAEAEKAVKGA